MNPEEPTMFLKRFMLLHNATCSMCIAALEEMECYVATTGDWPEGVHGLIEFRLQLMDTALKELEVTEDRRS